MHTHHKALIISALALAALTPALAQSSGTSESDPAKVNIHGTLRSKYEYQFDDNAGRFEVRTVRISVDG